MMTNSLVPIAKALSTSINTKTIKFVEGIKLEQYAGAAGRQVSPTWKPEHVMVGDDYLLDDDSKRSLPYCNDVCHFTKRRCGCGQDGLRRQPNSHEGMRHTSAVRIEQKLKYETHCNLISAHQVVYALADLLDGADKVKIPISDALSFTTGKGHYSH